MTQTDWVSFDFDSQTIFCESARQEIGGLVSLVGMFPDQINMERMPVPHEQPNGAIAPVIPQFCTYARSRFAIGKPIKGPLALEFRSPSNQVIFAHEIDQASLEESHAVALSQDKHFLTMITQFATSGFAVREAGKHTMLAIYGGQTYFSGAITFNSRDLG